ncbi:MAG: flagellin, partial [Deltaproteobacteria bacterium]|nr:flagellin [Deltaproteobacteria bacterium]
MATIGSVVIGNNVPAYSALYYLNLASQAVNRSLEHLSAGKRIISAADDSAGFMMSQRLQAQSTGLQQANYNIQDTTSMLQVADSYLAKGTDNISGVISAIRTRVLQAANDPTLTDAQRISLQSDINQLIDEIDGLAGSATYNSRYLLNGNMVATITSSDPQVLTGRATGRVSSAGYDFTNVQTATSFKGLANSPQIANLRLTPLGTDKTSTLGDATFAANYTTNSVTGEYDIVFSSPTDFTVYDSNGTAVRSGAVGGNPVFIQKTYAGQAMDNGASLATQGTLIQNLGDGSTKYFTSLATGDKLVWTGVNKNGAAVNGSQTITLGSTTVANLMSAVNTSLAGGVAATINAQGYLVIESKTPGPTGDFTFSSGFTLLPQGASTAKMSSNGQLAMNLTIPSTNSADGTSVKITNGVNVQTGYKAILRMQPAPDIREGNRASTLTVSKQTLSDKATLNGTFTTAYDWVNGALKYRVLNSTGVAQGDWVPNGTLFTSYANSDLAGSTMYINALGNQAGHTAGPAKGDQWTFGFSEYSGLTDSGVM